MKNPFETKTSAERVSPEKTKELFEKMNAAVDDPSAEEPLPEEIASVDNIKPISRKHVKAIAPKTGAFAMHEWQQKKEDEEDKKVSSAL
jgi:hypothetical protein